VVGQHLADFPTCAPHILSRHTRGNTSPTRQRGNGRARVEGIAKARNRKPEPLGRTTVGQAFLPDLRLCCQARMPDPRLFAFSPFPDLLNPYPRPSACTCGSHLVNGPPFFPTCARTLWCPTIGGCVLLEPAAGEPIVARRTHGLAAGPLHCHPTVFRCNVENDPPRRKVLFAGELRRCERIKRGIVAESGLPPGRWYAVSQVLLTVDPCLAVPFHLALMQRYRERERRLWQLALLAVGGPRADAKASADAAQRAVRRAARVGQSPTDRPCSPGGMPIGYHRG
jgi:hypothetical protein